MGIYWKASAHSWEKRRHEPWLDLGDYAEPIRKYVRGEGSFPPNVFLSATFLPLPVKLITFHLPVEQVSFRPQTYALYVPGIEFTLWTGADTPWETKMLNLSTGPDHLVLVLDVSDMIKRRFEIALGTARIPEINHPDINNTLLGNSCAVRRVPQPSMFSWLLLSNADDRLTLARVKVCICRLRRGINFAYCRE